MYLTYEEYENYGGTLDDTIFYNIETEVETLIDYVTFNRLKDDTEYDQRVKDLVFKLISLVYARNTMLDNSSSNSIIRSQSNDGVSVTYGGYRGMDASSIYNTSESTINSSIKKYLQYVRNSKGQLVLYRGLYPNE